MSEKLSKQSLLVWLGNGIYMAHNHSFDDEFNKKAREQIRSLIEEVEEKGGSGE